MKMRNQCEVSDACESLDLPGTFHALLVRLCFVQSTRTGEVQGSSIPREEVAHSLGGAPTPASGAGSLGAFVAGSPRPCGYSGHYPWVNSPEGTTKNLRMKNLY